MLSSARKSAKKAVESLYDSTCTIKAYGKSKDPITKETIIGVSSKPKYENQPCRVSSKILSKNTQGEVNNSVRIETKLFIDPSIIINQGDLIEVSGVNSKVYKAGEGFKYFTHQEVILSVEDKA